MHTEELFSFQNGATLKKKVICVCISLVSLPVIAMSESMELSTKDRGDLGASGDPQQDAVTNSSTNDQGETGVMTNKDNDDSDRNLSRRSKSGRRRSGFSRGRVSLTQLSKEASAADLDTVGSELYKQIPVELPAAERLSMLSRLQLRATLEVLDREFEDVPGFENFKAKALVSVGDSVDHMEKDGTFQQACSTPSLASNPVNLQMDGTISALSSCISRLEKEEGDWEELVHTLQTQAEQAGQQQSHLEVEYKDVSDEVRQLSQSFLPESSEDLELTDICQRCVRDVKTISLLMTEYSHSVQLVNRAHKAAGRDMDTLTATLGEGHSERCDPKESIQHLLAS